MIPRCNAAFIAYGADYPPVIHYGDIGRPVLRDLPSVARSPNAVYPGRGGRLAIVAPLARELALRLDHAPNAFHREQNVLTVAARNCRVALG